MLYDPRGYPGQGGVPYDLADPDRPPPQPPKLPDPFSGLITVIAIAVSIPNVLMHIYIDKRKESEDCVKKLAPFRIHPYRQARSQVSEDNPESHHMLQNAFFQSSADRSLKLKSEICQGYTVDDGLCIPLDEQEHQEISTMQSKFAAGLRKRIREEGGPPLTYPEARAQMKKELKTVKTPKPIDEETAECAAKLVDAQLALQCPSVLSGKTPMRTPGRSGN